MEVIQEHIKNKEFGLKNFDDTFNKYSNWKKEKVINFFKKYKEDIKRYVIGGSLFYLVLGEVEYKFKEFNYLGLFEKHLNKKMVNQLTTIINDITHNKNKNFISELDDLNKNEIKNFSIILYLRYYKEINQIMKKVLIEFLRDYDKKTILKTI